MTHPITLHLTDNGFFSNFMGRQQRDRLIDALAGEEGSYFREIT
jgi:hypothetical protein